MNLHYTACLFWTLTLIFVIAHGWGVSGFNGPPGVAPDGAYRFAEMWAYPLAVLSGSVAAVLHLLQWRRK